jgi:hypothetical protein
VPSTTASPSFHPDSLNHPFAQFVEGQSGAPERRGMALSYRRGRRLVAQRSGLEQASPTARVKQESRQSSDSLRRTRCGMAHGRIKLQLLPICVLARAKTIQGQPDGPGCSCSIVLASWLIGAPADLHWINVASQSPSESRKGTDILRFLASTSA